MTRRDWLAIGLLVAHLFAENQERLPADVSQANGSFQASSIERRTLTITNVMLTFSPFLELAKLDLTVAGFKKDVHPGELKPDTSVTRFSALTPKQKPQVAGQIVSAAGRTGSLLITAETTDAAHLRQLTRTEIPYENRNGQLKIAAPKPTPNAEPVRVGLKTAGSTTADGYIVTGEMRVALKGLSETPEKAAMNVTAEGVTLLTDAVPPLAQQLNGTARSISFAASDGQRGRVIAELAGTNRDGTPYLRRSYLYVLADARQVYLSSSGFVDVEIQKIKGDLAAHAITQAEFDRRVKSILAGKSEMGSIK